MAYQQSGSAGMSDAVNATIVVGAEGTNVREILITLLDEAGAAIDVVEDFEIVLYLNAARTAFVVTGGTTGIELGTGGNGAILAIVAKKVFKCTCEATGLLDLKWTDTGTEVAFIGVHLPNGRVVMSSSLANT